VHHGHLQNLIIDAALVSHRATWRCCMTLPQDAVSAGGPLLAVLGFIVLPIIWSVPEALVTAELATAFPEDSGYVAWVTAAFGPYWGFQEGFWSWCAPSHTTQTLQPMPMPFTAALCNIASVVLRLSGVTDNSLYPVMFMSYLDVLVPSLKTGPLRM